MLKKFCLTILAGIIFQSVSFNTFATAAYVEIKDIAFSYRPDIEPYFVLEAAKLRNQNSGYINKHKELESYHKIYNNLDGEEMNLTQWSSDAGEAPRMFKFRIRFKNYSPEASDEIPLIFTFYAKTGDCLVHPKTYLVDQANLQKTAKWIPFQTFRGTVPVLAGKESFDYFSEPIRFGEYLMTLKNRFPVAIKAEVRLETMNTTKTLEIPVYAKYFATETPY